MVLYSCKLCSYESDNFTHYKRHLATIKHQKKKESINQNGNNFILEQEKTYNCNICNKIFYSFQSLNRHKSLCEISSNYGQPKNKDTKLQKNKDLLDVKNNKKNINLINPLKEDICEKELQMAPLSSYNCAKITIKNAKNLADLNTKVIEPIRFICEFCNSSYSKQSNLNRHLKKCNSRILNIEENNQIEKLKKIIEEKEREKNTIILEKENEKLKAVIEEKDKTIEIAKNSKGIVTNIQNNTNNKTINFLNQNFGELIAMEKFLYNLEHHEKLTNQERNNLLIAYKENGIDVFARNFSYIMKQNCKRQMEKEGKEDMKLLPLFCSDGSLRSHKEKGKNGWKTHYDNQSINQMLNISNDQVYELHQELIPISGKDRNRVYNVVKRDNHVKNLKLLSYDDQEIINNVEGNLDNAVNNIENQVLDIEVINSGNLLEINDNIQNNASKYII